MSEERAIYGEVRKKDLDIVCRGRSKDGRWAEGYMVKVKFWPGDETRTIIIPKDAILFTNRIDGWIEVEPESVVRVRTRK